MAATLLIEYPLGTILPEIPAKSHFFYIPFTIKLFWEVQLGAIDDGKSYFRE
jgi:hypothetical protein